MTSTDGPPAFVEVTAYHPHHSGHGYDGNFFGVSMAHQQHFERGTVFFFGSKRFEVDGVSGEHEHEGGKTGQCYVNVTPGELRKMIGCSLMPGMRATFSPGPDLISRPAFVEVTAYHPHHAAHGYDGNVRACGRA